LGVVLLAAAIWLPACGAGGGGGGTYVCSGENYSGGADMCWETADTPENRSGCADQNRTFSEGTCADRGYTETCGTVLIQPTTTRWH